MAPMTERTPLGHNRCSLCNKLSPLYELFPSCRNCGEETCLSCTTDPSTLDDESNRVDECKACTRWGILEAMPDHKLSYDEREELAQLKNLTWRPPAEEAEAERDTLAALDHQNWTCGCGHTNGPNLARCAFCYREPNGGV